MRVLVTCVAGYIGRVIVEELLRKGHTSVVFDSLFNGHRLRRPSRPFSTRGGPVSAWRRSFCWSAESSDGRRDEPPEAKRCRLCIASGPSMLQHRASWPIH